MARFTKAELGKIKPGTWVTLQWPEVDLIQSVLLLASINPKQKGHICLVYFDPGLGRVSSAATHLQIVGVGNTLDVPEAQVQYTSFEEK